MGEALARERPRGLTKAIPAIADELVAIVPVIVAGHAEGKRQEAIRRAEAEERHRRWQAEEAAKRRAKAHEESRKQLLDIIDAWSLATRVEAFFAAARAEAIGLSPGEQERLAGNLERARSMFGGSAALPHFGRWRTPDDWEKALPLYW